MFAGIITNARASVKKLRGVATAAIAVALLLPCVAPAQERGSLKEAGHLSKQVKELHEQKRYKDAIPLAERLLRILKIKLSVAHPQYAEGLDYLARLYEVTGREAEVESLFRKALEDIREAASEEHPSYGIVLGHLAGFYFQKQRYADAEPLYIKALKLKSRTVGEQSLEYAESLDNLCALYYAMGRHAEVEPLLIKKIDAIRKAVGEGHPDYARNLNTLSRLYDGMGREEEADAVLAKVLEAAGEKHPRYAAILTRLGRSYFRAGKYAEAEPLLAKAVEATRKAAGEEHPDFTQSLDNLSALYFVMGRYAEVEPLLAKALELTRKSVGEEHPDFATGLNTLGKMYYVMGRYAEAEPLFIKALEILRKAGGEAHPDYPTVLSNLAMSYYHMGRYAEAEPRLVKAQELIRKAVGDEHPDFAKGLDNLAKLTMALGLYTDAELLFTRALEVMGKAVGEEDPAYAAILINRAMLHYVAGEYTDAEPLLTKAVEVMRKAVGEEHPMYATSLNNLAAIYDSMGRYADAEPRLVKVLEVKRRVLGEQHPEYAMSLHNLSAVYLSMGRYADAEPRLIKALEAMRKAVGEEHPDYTLCLKTLALLYVKTGRPREALSTLSRAMLIEQVNLRRVFAASSEAVMFEYLSTVSNSFDALINLANVERHSHPEAVGEALTWVLRRKGLILDTAVRFRRAQLLAESDPALVASVARLRHLRQRLSSLTLSPPAGMSTGTLRQELIWARAEANQFEVEFNRVLSSKTQEQVETEINLETVRRRLAAGSALIEFVRADIIDFKAVGKPQRREPARYFAFVLTADPKSPPRMIDLGDAEKVERAILRLREHMAATNHFLKGATEEQIRAAERDREDGYRIVAKELYDLVFEPVRRELGGAKTVYLSTDSQLSLVPFEALAANSGEGAKYLIEEYRFAYLTGGRDLLRVRPPTGRGAAVFANPGYDLAAEQRAAELKKLETQAAPPQKPAGATPEACGTAGAAHAPPAAANVGRGTYRGALPPDVRLRSGGLTWPPLKNSAAEGADVCRTLSGTSFGPVAHYTGGRASEDALKRVRSPHVLHLSTHGFFLPDPPKQQPGEGAGTFGVGLQSVDGAAAVGLARLGVASGVSPLLRSGFVLAGANRLGEQLPQSPQAAGVEDGWVTAEEAALLDLSGTELAVLSACGTGLGTVPAGEGVYGLRRALRLAGVSTVVSTLFDVPDQESAGLMRNFYVSLKSGQGKLDALRGAQLRLIKERREKGGAAHPFFWAGFVLSGDPN
jgi:tetratricopeptide (TPR) repeat protein